MEVLSDKIVVRIATPEVFDQIHALNHETFAIEIPQHQKKDNAKLIDAFHEQNTYIIALEGNDLVGMVCFNDCRTFSLDKKLPNLDSYLPSHSKLVEIRLFAIRKNKRKQRIAYLILKHLATILLKEGYDLAVISAALNELKMYKNIGAIPFGPLVGSNEVFYQPMYIPIHNLKTAFRL